MMTKQQQRSPLLWAVIFFAACSGNKTDADSVAHTPIPAPEQCEAPYDTSIPAQPAVVEAIGVARYDVTADAGAIHVAMHDADGEHLGNLNTDVAVDVAGGLISQFRINSSYIRDDEVRAEQRWRVMSVGGNRTWIEVTNAVDDVEVSLWVMFDADLNPTYRALAFEVDEPGPNVQLSNGRLWDVLEIAATGDVADDVQPWLDAHIGTHFEDSEDWRVLTIVGNDAAPLDAIDATFRGCHAAATGAAQDEITRTSALCPMTESTETRHAASCLDVVTSTIATSAEVYSGISGAVKSAKDLAGLATMAAASGVVGGGGLFIVGAVLGVWVMTTAIDKAITSNPDAWKGGSIRFVGGTLAGVETSAAEDFFTGGGGGGGGKNGTTVGDPHLRTFDGLSYQLHNAGEFVLVRSDVGEPFEVQARQEPRSSPICSGIAVNTAFAIQSGSSRITITPDKTWIDGVRGELGAFTTLDGGGYIERSGNRYLVVTPSGDVVGVTQRREFVDAEVSLSDARKGSAQGLLGNDNGIREDDIALPNGVVLPAPVSSSDLRDRFGEAWRVTSATSLFDYASGESNSTFYIANFPLAPTSIDAIPEADRARAEEACAEVTDAGAFVGCVIDVACTGDNDFVDSHRDRTTEETLELLDPTNLTGWTVVGDGDWRIAPDGTGATQQSNGEPTFYISGDDFFDTTVRGRIRSNAQSDDDIVGVVFGYQPSPDDPNLFRTFVLSWKAKDELGAPEGFVLYHLNGVVEPVQYTRVLWELDESNPALTVLARDTGEGRGWGAFIDYPFEVTYTADRIVVVVGGEEIFDISASETSVPFESGRFGFYNFSQPSVRYHSLLVEPAVANPTESLNGLMVGTDHPGATYRTVELDVADPRICQSICRADGACEVFVYRRPVFNEHGASCELKDRVPPSVADSGAISGLR